MTNNLKPIYGKVSIYELPKTDEPTTSLWDIELLNNMFYEKKSIQIGSIIKGEDGTEYNVSDISFSFRDYTEDNKIGYDSAAINPIGKDNLTVKVFIDIKKQI